LLARIARVQDALDLRRLVIGAASAEEAVAFCCARHRVCLDRDRCDGWQSVLALGVDERARGLLKALEVKENGPDPLLIAARHWQGAQLPQRATL
jgi:hypothetical protein